MIRSIWPAALTRMAVEDVGLADPRALQVCTDCWETYTRLGSPEGDLALAQAALYLAAAPKSNALYSAFGEVKASLSEHGSLEVPVHLRNAPTQLAKEMGHGAEYRYAHDEVHTEQGGYAAGENYLPQEIQDARFYHPKEVGLESRIKEKMAHFRQLDEQAPNKRYK